MALRKTSVTGLGGPGGASVQYKVQVTPSPELQQFMRDHRGRYIPGMQLRVAEAHRYMMRIYQEEIYKAFKERQQAYPTGNRRGTSQANSSMYKALVLDFDISPLGKLTGKGQAHLGFELDLDRELNKRIVDDQGRAYWRWLEEGGVRSGEGHLFVSNSGKWSGPSEGRVDPRMPFVGAKTRFRYSFGGYRFVDPGHRKASARIKGQAGYIYMRFMEFPKEMQRVATFFGQGGTQQGARSAFPDDPRFSQD